MSRLDDLKVLYSNAPSDNRVKAFENIFPPCRILNLLSMEDIMQLNQIAKSKKLSSKPAEKLNMIKDIMWRRGFKRLSSGTNRICFKFTEDQSFVVKVAYDSVGLSDNLNELYNQELIKPFCAKVFDVTPCGTVGMFERVRPIRNREEFQSIAYDVFDIIVNEFVGKYVLADIGTKFFMNWGVRLGMFPVILDFPYIYELDGARIHCNRPDPSSPYGFCGGDIDYDEGFNHLVCTKCGKTFLASDLKLAAEKKSNDLIIEQEDINMVVEIKRGDTVVNSIDTSKESDTYKKTKKKETPYEYRQRRKFTGIKVEINKSTVEVEEEKQKTVTSVIPQQNVSPEQFNHGWATRDIPSVDKMYKDTTIEIKGRHIKDDGKDKFEKEFEKKNRDAETVEDIIATGQVYLNNEEEIKESNTDVSEQETEEQDPHAEVKKTVEIILGDKPDSDNEDSQDIYGEY